LELKDLTELNLKGLGGQCDCVVEQRIDISQDLSGVHSPFFITCLGSTSIISAMGHYQGTDTSLNEHP
jgi:hypothetical protein